jgi:hypothetical protein
MTRQNCDAARTGREDAQQAGDGLSLAELEAQSGTALPAREALSTIPSDPSTALLDIVVDLDAALDLAAPINAALAANANVALPIDAAVSANVLSPGSVSLADANQTAIIEQVLQGDATASSNQDSAIMQGEGGGTAVSDAGGQTGELESAPIPAAPAEPVEQIAPAVDPAAGTDAADPVAQVQPVEQAPVEQVEQAPVEPVAPETEPAAAPQLVEQASAEQAPVEQASAEQVVSETEPAAAPEPVEEVAPVSNEGFTTSGHGLRGVSE